MVHLVERSQLNHKQRKMGLFIFQTILILFLTIQLITIFTQQSPASQLLVFISVVLHMYLLFLSFGSFNDKQENK
ncbi:hypothetical protein [Texcoconibacillus texcoconensis]|uniref:Steroid 5-alpha reductase family enzyme n=1 Tax=Texcoconibacillus texcoconensis TaxID=1095777 RepID=A0A840QRU4_9BACI|nr:hypothetical protein [Texcoconibacillus texcoconensis]MBB5174043.1 steroid 5-alpha reductase family enzyme [Texcoconibacillus texcoconensis]